MRGSTEVLLPFVAMVGMQIQDVVGMFTAGSHAGLELSAMEEC